MDVTEPTASDPTERERRIHDLAALMRSRGDGPGEGLTVEEARAAGFGLAEIEAYRDEAVALVRSGARVPPTSPPGRMCGHDLVRLARAIRRRRSAEP